MKLDVRLKLDGQKPTDLRLQFGRTATVGDLAGAIARSGVAIPNGAFTLRPEQRVQGALHPDTLVNASGLSSGSVVYLDSPPSSALIGAGASVRVLEGPDAGLEIHLGPGVHIIGRSNEADVPLSDQQVSREHAVLEVGDRLLISDRRSQNGVIVDGVPVGSSEQVEVNERTRVGIGGTVLMVQQAAAPGDDETNPGRVPFNRPPRVLPPPEGVKIELPTPPPDPQRQPLPILTSLMPLLMGVVLFAVTRSAITLVFFALTPMLFVGGYIENKRFRQQEYERLVAEFREDVQRAVDKLVVRQAAEQNYFRWRFEPSIATVELARTRGSRLWERDSIDPDALVVRVGTGQVASLNRLVAERTGSRRFREMIEALPEEYQYLSDMPVTVDLREVGSLGLSGQRQDVMDMARAVVAQQLAFHPPGDLAVACLLSDQGARSDWDWLKWVPHVASPLSPLSTLSPLAIGDDAGVLLAELLRISTEGNTAPALLLVIIDDRAPLPPPGLAAFLESLPQSRVAALWTGTSTTAMPHTIGSLVEVEPVGVASRLYGTRDGVILEVEPDRMTAADVDGLGRSLAPIVDIAQRHGAEAGVPDRVSFHSLVGGFDVLERTEFIKRRWKLSGSPDERSRLAAPIGESGTGPFEIDIRHDGPHALVAGTTGAGKSELLQTWVAALAVTHSPERVTFLLVDYKGGAAFKDCDRLPHTIGLVTDLNRREVHRALTSLSAEIGYREHLLASVGAKDLVDMEESHPQLAPPSLLIVVDEFAALAKEVPEFVDGVVDVAARGRSLGLHLVLATQRPAGVITAAIRANTGLRIALRVSDESESEDVLGVRAAAHLDRRRPGRAMVKRGASEIDPIQAGYAGGSSRRDETSTPVSVGALVVGAEPPPYIDARRSPAGVIAELAPPSTDAATSPPTDLQRVVANVNRCVEELRLAPPRKAWLAPLLATYDLDELIAQFEGEFQLGRIPLGRVDEPDLQRQRGASLDLGSAGGALVFGTSGSGKTGVLRTVAAAVGSTPERASTIVYALDFAGRGLDMIKVLPHVGSVIPGTDVERVVRLLGGLRSEIAERANRLGAVQADDFEQYRTQAPDDPLTRIVVLLDGLDGFTSGLEKLQRGRWVEELPRLVSSGRAVGVNFVMTADRRQSVPAELFGVVQSRIVLRMANADEALRIDLGVDDIDFDAPPGRGVFEGRQIQIAVPGGSAVGTTQAEALAATAARLRALGVPEAPEIDSLPTAIGLSELPGAAGRLVIGLEDAQLRLATVPRDVDHLVVFGPRRSGRSSAAATIGRQLLDEGVPVHLVTLSSGLLSEALPWTTAANGVEAVEASLAALVEGGPGPGGRPWLVIDNVGDFGDTTVESSQFEAVTALAHSGALHLLLIGDSAVIRRGYGGVWELAKEACSAGVGLLMQATSDTDGSFLGASALAPTPTAMNVPGRAYLVIGGQATVVQVADAS